jgi:hypothetical protein
MAPHLGCAAAIGDAPLTKATRAKGMQAAG